MEINKTAIAGTLESSDVQIMISKGTSGIQFEVESDVEKQFGDQIRQTVTDVLRQYDVKNVDVKIVDKGALDMVIKARTIAAVQRALDIVDQPKWEVL